MMRHGKERAWRLVSLLLVFLMVLEVWLGDRPLSADDETPSIPVVTIEGAYHPDWSEFSFSDIPPVLEGGGFDLPSQGDLGDYTGEEVVNFLGYDPSRSWEAGASISNILKLGDFESTLATWSLGTVANYAGIDLQGLKLSDFRLLESMSLEGLLEAIPNLGVFKLKQVKPLYDAAKIALGVKEAVKWANLPLGDLGEAFDYAKFEFLDTGGLSLAGVDLSQYGLDAIPGLEAAAFSGFSNWKGSFISDVPGLDFVPIAKFIFGLGTGSFLGKIDVVYGDKEANRTNTITGSFEEGFNVPCNQPNCAHLEMTDAINIGNISVLKGKQWISGNSQEVSGGSGFLTWVNGGKEPTGRHPFGDLFKVVLLETNESRGEGQFGIYFRFCLNAWFVRGCSPYFIGPFPWFSNREKDLIFVGLDGVTSAIPDGLPDIPQNPGIPAEYLNDPRIAEALQQQQDYGSPSQSGDVSDCTSVGGVSMAALQRAIARKESGGQSDGGGDYYAVGRYVNLGGPERGHALGKYQYMTYREDIVPYFQVDAEGRQILNNAASGYYNHLGQDPRLKAAIKQYFPPAAQERVRSSDFRNLVNAAIRLGRKGDAVIAQVATWHYVGPNDRGSINNDYANDVVSYYRQEQPRSALACAQAPDYAGVQTGGGAAIGKCPSSGVLSLVQPSEGVFTSGFRTAHRSGHQGIDIAAPVGTAIKAAAAGKVIKVHTGCHPTGGYYGNTCGGKYGNHIYVQHCNGWVTRYAHLSKVNVRRNQIVSAGQNIGSMGNSGSTTGPHLHFEVRVNGGSTPVDPVKYLR